MEVARYSKNDYEIIEIDNQIIIKFKTEINRIELLELDLTYSIIISAINNDEIYPNSYKGILDKILCKFTAKRLKQISKYPIIDGEFLENGYYYIERLNISYKGLCANDCKKEILNLLEHTGDTFEIKIKLSNGRIIIFKQN